MIFFLKLFIYFYQWTVKCVGVVEQAVLGMCRLFLVWSLPYLTNQILHWINFLLILFDRGIVTLDNLHFILIKNGVIQMDLPSWLVAHSFPMP